MPKVLITGSAGFIGFHLALRLLQDGHEVCGIDNLDSYYDVSLKKRRLGIINESLVRNNNSNHQFFEVDLSNQKELSKLFKKFDFDYIINLAAQAGVRHSIINPYSFNESNLLGFLNLLECCKDSNIKHLIYASSSSVYGMNSSIPFKEGDNTDKPVSFYAATKKANELMAYCYSHLNEMPVTGLRFFTVYGPYGRPDMAYFSFTKSILEGSKIEVYNNGEMQRDFTYIDDIIKSIRLLIPIIPEQEKKLHTNAISNIFNIGNNEVIPMKRFIKAIENACGKKAIIEYLPMQPGDVVCTYSDITNLQDVINFSPETSIEDGINKFVTWYKEFYKI